MDPTPSCAQHPPETSSLPVALPVLALGSREPHSQSGPVLGQRRLCPAQPLLLRPEPLLLRPRPRQCLARRALLLHRLWAQR